MKRKEEKYHVWSLNTTHLRICSSKWGQTSSQLWGVSSALSRELSQDVGKGPQTAPGRGAILAFTKPRTMLFSCLDQHTQKRTKKDSDISASPTPESLLQPRIYPVNLPEHLGYTEWRKKQFVLVSTRAKGRISSDNNTLALGHQTTLLRENVTILIHF